MGRRRRRGGRRGVELASKRCLVHVDVDVEFVNNFHTLAFAVGLLRCFWRSMAYGCSGFSLLSIYGGVELLCLPCFALGSELIS